MAVVQTKKQSDLEKRLKLLRQSLSVTEKKTGPQKKFDYSEPKSIPVRTSSISQDVNYLKKDLFKIATLTILAFATQIGLYFALANHLIKLPI